MDPTSLDTLGESTLGGQLAASSLTAHYRVTTEPDGSRRWVSFSMDTGFGGTSAIFYEFDEQGRKVHETKQGLEGVSLALVHDMLVSEHYYVLIMGPVEFSPKKFATEYLFSRCSIAECLEYNPGGRTRVVLVPRPGRDSGRSEWRGGDLGWIAQGGRVGSSFGKRAQGSGRQHWRVSRCSRHWVGLVRCERTGLEGRCTLRGMPSSTLICHRAQRCIATPLCERPFLTCCVVRAAVQSCAYGSCTRTRASCSTTSTPTRPSTPPVRRRRAPSTTSPLSYWTPCGSTRSPSPSTSTLTRRTTTRVRLGIFWARPGWLAGLLPGVVRLQTTHAYAC